MGGGFHHPGLFQTACKGGDLLGLFLALLLEIYGLFNLMRVGSIALFAALALVAIDLAGALLSHFKQATRCAWTIRPSHHEPAAQHADRRRRVRVHGPAHDCVRIEGWGWQKPTRGARHSIMLHGFTGHCGLPDACAAGFGWPASSA